MKQLSEGVFFWDWESSRIGIPAVFFLFPMLCFSQDLIQASDLAELREARRELRKSRGSAGGKRSMAEVGLLKVVDVEFHWLPGRDEKKEIRKDL